MSGGLAFTPRSLRVLPRVRTDFGTAKFRLYRREFPNCSTATREKPGEG